MTAPLRDQVAEVMRPHAVISARPGDDSLDVYCAECGWVNTHEHHKRVYEELISALVEARTTHYPYEYARGLIRTSTASMPQPERGWYALGYGPQHNGRWSRFRQHLGHGLLMQYPIRYVIAFSIRGLFWRWPS